MDFNLLLQRLFAQNQFAIKMGLEAMEHAVDALGLARVAPRVVLVGGTNGKGSTCAALASMADALGWHTGLYTSPHLLDFRERIRIDGQPVDQRVLTELGHAIMARFSGQDQPAEGPRALTYFELVTLMALAAFSDARPRLDLVILEVGMGGRLDAVNAVERDLVLLTGVALDHQDVLGDTIEAIAAEKAGLARPGGHVLIPDSAAGGELLVRACQARGATVECLAGAEGGSPAAQARALAGEALRRLAAGDLSEERVKKAVAEGGARFQWPGRQERRVWRGRPVLIDGAHNAQSAAACAAWLGDLGYGPGRRVQVVTGLSGQRRMEDVLGPILPFAARWHVTEPSARAMPAAQVREALESSGCDLVTSHATAGEALEAALAHDEDILVMGSLYLVGDALLAMGVGVEELRLWPTA